MHCGCGVGNLDANTTVCCRQSGSREQRVWRAGGHADHVPVGFELQCGRSLQVAQVNGPALNFLKFWQISHNAYGACRFRLCRQKFKHER